MNLDINRVITYYKEKVAELEHNLILHKVMVEQLQEELIKMSKNEVNKDVKGDD